MTVIVNSSFEEAGATPGEALGWTLVTLVANQEVADFDGTGWESFDWIDLITKSDDVAATFGPADLAEDFEQLWGPFDGSDPKFGVLVPPIGYPGNQSFLFALGQTLDALFVGGGSVEGFEIGWNQDTPLLTWDDVDAEIAVFVGGDLFEDFESGWNNDDFKFEFLPAELASASFYFTVPKDVEDFERVIPYEDVAEILVSQLGPYTATLNGVAFTYETQLGDSTSDIVIGIVERITNSSLKFSAAQLSPSTIGFINNDPNQELTTVIEGPAQATVALLTDQLSQDFWLLPDKGI